jgi:hypothetical protein
MHKQIHCMSLSPPNSDQLTSSYHYNAGVRTLDFYYNDTKHIMSVGSGMWQITTIFSLFFFLDKFMKHGCMLIALSKIYITTETSKNSNTLYKLVQCISKL